MCAAVTLAVASGCVRRVPDEGPLNGTSKTLIVTGQYRRAALDRVDGISIENGKLVLKGSSAEVVVDLPPNADPDQKNRGWALVTEGELDTARMLTFTHETSLDDFTIQVPNSGGQIQYGSVGGRDGKDVLIFAYGSDSRCYWGWASVAKK